MDGSLNREAEANDISTYYMKAKTQMMRFPGMVPTVAPYGPQAVPHAKPGAPFFGFAVKTCPGSAENKCCLVVEGDGDIETRNNNDGKAEAVDKITRANPSTLASFQGVPSEYRASWSILSSHTAFSRVLPDIGSYDTGAGTSQMWNGAKKLPESDIVKDVRNFIQKNKKTAALNSDIFKGSSTSKTSKIQQWGGKTNKQDPIDAINGASGKCFWQRRWHGARERVATMLLEHFYVALNNECVSRLAQS
jgi:hypothetical protein